MHIPERHTYACGTRGNSHVTLQRMTMRDRDREGLPQIAMHTLRQVSFVTVSLSHLRPLPPAAFCDNSFVFTWCPPPPKQ